MYIQNMRHIKWTNKSNKIISCIYNVLQWYRNDSNYSWIIPGRILPVYKGMSYKEDWLTSIYTYYISYYVASGIYYVADALGFTSEATDNMTFDRLCN